MATVADAERIVNGLPQVTEDVRYGNRCWMVGRTAFAWVRPFSKADIRRFGAEPPPGGPILAVRVDDLGEKEAVLASNIDGVFTIPHFDGDAAVLIQLESVSETALEELVVDAWLACAPRSAAEAFVASGSSPASDRCLGSEGPG